MDNMSTFTYSKGSIEKILDDLGYEHRAMNLANGAPASVIFVNSIDKHDLYHTLEYGHLRYGIAVMSNAIPRYESYRKYNFYDKSYPSVKILVYDFVLKQPVRQLNASVAGTDAIRNITRRVQTAVELVNKLEKCPSCNAVFNIKTIKTKKADRVRKRCTNPNCKRVENVYADQHSI